MDTEKLVMLVYEQECLWNLNSENYHSRDLQRKAWKEIAAEMKCTGDDLKKKWRGLRDIFRREFKKSTSHKSGDASKDYTSKWPFYNLMFFLKDIMTPRNLEGSVPEPESEPTDIDEADFEDDDDDNIATRQRPSTTPTTPQTLLPQIHQSSSSKSLFKSPPKKKNRRQNQAANYDEAFLRIEQEKLKYFKGPVQESEMQFLMSLHPFLKKIPASQQLSVRADLMQVLMKNQPTPSYLPTPSPAPSPGYQSSSEDWVSDCSSSQPSTSYVIQEGTRHLPTQYNPPQLQTFFTSFDPTDIEERS